MGRRITNREAWLLTSIFLAGGLVLTGLSCYFYNGTAVFFVTLFCAYFLHGTTFSLLMLAISLRGLRRRPAAPPPTDNISIIVPVFNEAEVIVHCVESLMNQSLRPREIIVVNDGSTDETLMVLRRAFDLLAISDKTDFNITCGAINGIYESLRCEGLRVIDKRRGGKADGLNAALNLARGEVFITVDADSFIHPQAIERLVAALLADDEIVAAGGTVKAANGIAPEILASDNGSLPVGLLPKMQWLEYATGFVWRFGWAHMNTLLLLSGSFSAFRTDVLRRCGGFDATSITEDYEMAYRLHAYHLSKGLNYRMVTVGDALAYTLVPETMKSLLQQRLRWFQGFLQTLFRYRELVLRPRFGVLGIFMLPIKCIDAVAPIWSLITYLLLALHLILRPFPVPLSVFAGLILFRLAVDILMCWLLLTIHQQHIVPRLPRAQLVALCLLSPGYLLFNQVFWLVYGLGAYYRSVKGVERWDKAERQAFLTTETQSAER